MPRPEIIQGSILDSDCDVIVNPANSHLRHGGGLARIIARAATGHPLGAAICDPEVPGRAEKRAVAEAWLREQDRHPLIPTGGAGATSAGLLPYEAIIHAVGPIWGGGHFMECPLLWSAHSEALRIAEAMDVRSIAFPAISCGIFGYPVEQAAQVATRAGVLTRLRVVFYLVDDEHFTAYSDALAEIPENAGESFDRNLRSV